ncbi:MAG: hypothetical protein JWO17_2070 [Actinomycetia bacterium]|jgi:hypothetical protein|nr:hypothetical protein [Actinomycetes bacterium]
MATPENRPNYAPGPNWPAGARLPIPGNAEWLWWAVMAIVVAIVALASDRVDSSTWVDFMKWTTAAYLISRGIAKASRVLEQ